MSTAWAGGALVLILVGMLMKAAMLPVRIDYQMHPATAPTPVSGYISAMLLKSGPYGVLKLMVLTLPNWPKKIQQTQLLKMVEQ